MRLLSQMTTDETCDVLCIAAPHIQNMADDKTSLQRFNAGFPKGNIRRLTSIGSALRAL